MIALLLAALAVAGPSGRISTANSTATTLTGSSSYTGQWEKAYEYGSIRVRVVSAGTVDVFMQFSENCSTTDSNVKASSDSTNMFHTLAPFAECYRLVVTDTSGGSNAIRAESYLMATTAPLPATRIDGALDRYSNAIAVRPISDFDFDTSRGKIGGFSTIHKFGRNNDCSTSAEFVNGLSSTTYAGWLTAATTIRVKAGGNAADTAAGAGAREVTCEGLDENWNEVSDTMTTAGAAESSATTATFVRVNRCYVSSAGTYHGAANLGANTGAITIEASGGSADLALIRAGRGQTAAGHYTCPASKTCYIRGTVVCSEGSKGADFYLYQLQNADDASAPVSSPRLVQQWPGVNACATTDHKTWEAYPEKTDLWFTCIATTGNNIDVTVEMEVLIEDAQ